jgi:hypothetical protein
MEIKFADSFWKSLQVLARHQTWWYKAYEVLRYKIPMFFENLWFFRKELWYFRSWDYTFNLQLFARSLEKTVNTLENHGNEIESTRMKKVEKIKRVIQLIKNIDESNYISMAESELGEIKNSGGWIMDIDDTPEEHEHNRKVYDRAREIEKSEHNELWMILKGQDINEFSKLHENLSDEEKMKYDHWEKWYDGSGITNWWD